MEGHVAERQLHPVRAGPAGSLGVPAERQVHQDLLVDNRGHEREAEDGRKFRRGSRAGKQQESAVRFDSRGDRRPLPHDDRLPLQGARSGVLQEALRPRTPEGLAADQGIQQSVSPSTSKLG